MRCGILDSVGDGFTDRRAIVHYKSLRDCDEELIRRIREYPIRHLGTGSDWEAAEKR